MSAYYFYDTDPCGYGFEEYDIAGEDFKELIETCCRYCETLSLLILEEKAKVAEKRLEPYRIPKPEAITCDPYAHYGWGELTGVRYYRTCPELCALLPQIADHIFRWRSGWRCHNPEDPVFYRSDGSMFFFSIIHDGECMLMPREGEDVSHVVSKEHWLTEDNRHMDELVRWLEKQE